MLRGIQKASTHWLGRAVLTVVLGALAVSFAIWGINDIFRGFGLSSVAKIGETEIGVQQFREIYNNRLQQLGRQLGRTITPEEARVAGLDRQVLGQLIAEAALDERARELRLGLSDSEVAKRIMDDPNFKGFFGQFDRARFDAIIRQSGYSEARYVAEQRRQLLRHQIIDSIAGALTAPKAAIEAAHRHQNEQRSIEYVLLDRGHAGEIAAPTPEALAKYFEERKPLFRAPEYRKLVLLTVNPADIAKAASISEADAKRFYDERSARYTTPERRMVQQMVFSKPEEAQAAAARLAQGVTFEALAAERGLKSSDIDLGTVTKSDIIDRAVADAAFSLKEGAVSAPVQGRFGTALVRVSKIEPEQVRKYEQVAADIKREIATERAKAEIAGLRDKIEDERAGGATLAETAQKLNLPTVTIEAMDRFGRAPGGAPVSGQAPSADLVTAAFATEVGVENDPLQMEGGGYIWYDVIGVTPSSDRNLDDVKAEVEARWRNDEVAARLAAKAATMVEKLNAGTALKDVAAAEKLKVATASGLTREKFAEPLSPQATAAVFRTAKGSAGAAQGQDATKQIVFRVTEAGVPPLDPASDETKRMVNAMRVSMADDLLNEYAAQLQAEVGTHINPTALNQVLGGTAN